MKLPRSDGGKPAYDVARKAILEAGKLLVDGFQKGKEVTVKGRGNVVTNLDYEAEALVIGLLRREYPDFGIMSEESQPVRGNVDYTWILDPLDGTRNYASGNPVFAVNLGLLRGGEVVLGLTYDPFRDELFHAIRGEGAYLNDRPISVSDQASVQDSVVGLDMGYNDELARYALEMLVSLWPGLQSVRITGSAALGLAYAAAGRIDIYIHHALAPWDLVSGILLVQEAGGVVTAGDGSPMTPWTKSVVATNTAIHADFLRRTEGCQWRRSVAELAANSAP